MPADPTPSPSPSETPSPGPSPSPSETPNPSPGPAPSAGSSTGSSAGRFAVDPGPAFDAGDRPQTEPAPAPEPEAAPADVDLWDERRVRALLTAKGAVLHGLVAVDKGSTEWSYTEADLAAIAPPLTAILNRYEPTRAAAHAGDELALVVGLAGYAGRSIRERREALAQLADVEPEPITGVPAEHGPADDPDWQRQHGAPIPDPDSEPAPLGRPGR